MDCNCKVRRKGHKRYHRVLWPAPYCLYLTQAFRQETRQSRDDEAWPICSTLIFICAKASEGINLETSSKTTKNLVTARFRLRTVRPPNLWSSSHLGRWISSLSVTPQLWAPRKSCTRRVKLVPWEQKRPCSTRHRSHMCIIGRITRKRSRILFERHRLGSDQK